MKVLYVTNSARRERPYLDPAVRYRCYNFAEVLRDNKNLVNVIHYQDLKMDYISYFDVIVFHKPPFTKNLQAAVAYGEKLNKNLIADYDDLIFDAKNALYSSLYLNGRASERIAVDIFKRNHKALKLFNKVTVSTTELKCQVLQSHIDADVQVIHNGMSSIWVDRASQEITNKPTYGLIGYFSGTSSHNHDWEMIEDTVSNFLQNNSQCKLRIVGPLKVDEKKFDKSSLEIIKAVEYEKLPTLINTCWVNIAPLEDNIFNSCKSGLKFFEAGILNTPTIASPIPDMARFSDSGIMLAENLSKWEEHFYMIMDKGIRNKLSEEVYEYSKVNCMAENQYSKLHEFYK
ncbi:hypothetical protein [Rahnella sp. PAMC 25559]|uniref:hypothetical protein n=1 Tax=Rahnella sp. PAMC 25559 TaxID=3423225 RepID=UPI003D6785A0